MDHLIAVFVLFMIFAKGSLSAIVSDIVQPINIPEGAVKCSQPLVNTKFLGSSPLIEVPYVPPSNCGLHWAMIVLELSGFCRAPGLSKEQNVGGVWLDGAQILHVTTPLPTPQGTNWTVQRDVSIFESLFISSSNLSVIFREVTPTSSLTGSYNISISVNFYSFGRKTETKQALPPISRTSRFTTLAGTTSGLFPPPAIVPIHPPPSKTTGLWFSIEDDQLHSVMVTAPTSTIGAGMLVFASSHGEDEFWYETGIREVLITIDDVLVDAIWPTPVIYSSGVNISFWQSVGAIGALNFPSYEIVLDAFAGVLADGKPHKFGFQVTGAKKTWFLAASMYIFQSSVTKAFGSLIHASASVTNISHPEPGTTRASRIFSSLGFHVVNGVNVTAGVEHQLSSRSWKSKDGSFHHLLNSRIVYTSQGSGDALYLHWVDEISAFLALSSKVDQSLDHKFDSVLRIGGNNNGTVRGGNFTSTFANHQVASEEGTRQTLSRRDTHHSCYSRDLLVANFVYKYDNVSTSCA